RTGLGNLGKTGGERSKASTGSNCSISFEEECGLTIPRRVQILGVPVDLLTQDQIFDVIESSINKNRKTILASQNLYGVYLYWTNEPFRELHRRAVIFVDGMSLVMLGALKGYGISRQHRNTPLDWILPVLELAAARAWRVFYLGGSRDTLQR